MTVIVTIGPTQEPLDAMRILTNRSSGELGTLLAATLAKQGHRVIALRGTGSTASTAPLLNDAIRVIPFTTTDDLSRELEKASHSGDIGAVFHAAAVSDFYLPGARSGKIPTKEGALTLTLNPTPKLLPKMRDWFPSARISGWKFEAGGSREASIEAGRCQITSCGTDACVVNGPSYGEGFALLQAEGNLLHLSDKESLCTHLAEGLQPN